MRDYLDGYLDIVPQSERTKIQEVLKTNREIVGSGVTENEFIQLINKIIEEHTRLTEEVEQGERLSSNAYNQFFGNVQVDLNVMFAESNLIERALMSYDRLYDGIIADLAKEIKALRERVNSLRLVAEGEDGLIVKSVDFSNSTEMETDRTKFAHLFRDRDGSDLPDIGIQRNDDNSYVRLGLVASADRIRNEDGTVVATITVKDQRGIPMTQTKYGISNAIDSSRDTYWGEVVLADEPITTLMDNYEGSGAMSKFTVELPRQQVISEISIAPFTSLPMQIVSVKYEEDIETFHEPKEILTAPVEGTETILLQFPSIIARRLTFILRQENYVKNIYLVRDKDLEKAELWDKISQREAEVTLDDATPETTITVDQSDLDTWTGWDIYKTELAKYEEDYAKWLKEVEDYNVAYAKYEENFSAYIAKYGNVATKATKATFL
jgi:predicted nucleic acid-binding protein